MIANRPSTPGKSETYDAVTAAPERTYCLLSTTPFRTVTMTGPLISGRHSHERAIVTVYDEGARRAHCARAAASSPAGAVPERQAPPVNAVATTAMATDRATRVRHIVCLTTPVEYGVRQCAV